MVAPDRAGKLLFHLGLLPLAILLALLIALVALALHLNAPIAIVAACAPLALMQSAALLAVRGWIEGHALVRISYGTLKLLQRPLGIPLHAPERMVVLLNNGRVLSQGLSGFSPEQVLVLVPHCLQDHTCSHRLTFEPDNCQRCGNCPVGDLLDIRDRFGVRFAISTGGTSARKTVSDIRPELIVAVACPVDLSLGIMDVHPITTVGILNEWRNGACFDTWVDTGEVTAILEELAK